MTEVMYEFKEMWDRHTSIEYINMQIQKRKDVCVALSDVDFFVNIDSKVGKIEGDKILYRMVEFFKKKAGEFKVGRYGGDEFIFIYMGKELEQVRGEIEQLRKDFRKQRFISNDSIYAKVPISSSFGITSNEYNNDVLKLLKAAETALAMAKKRGRNQVVVAPESEIIVLNDRNADVMTIIGGGLRGYDDIGYASNVKILEPYGVDINEQGELLITDRGNHMIRRIRIDGSVDTIAGHGEYGYIGDGGNARLAKLNKPSGVAIGSDNQIYIADTGNHCIREIDQEGKIHTIAGCGQGGYEGDGEKAIYSKLSRPGGVVTDQKGNVYTNDYGNNVIRMISPDGLIYTVAGSGEFGYSGDGKHPLEAAMNRPYGLAVTPYGDKIYIADYGNNCIREVDVNDKVIRTVCGTGEPGYEGDGGEAVKARLNGPFWLSIWHPGYLLIADAENNCIRICNLKTNIIQTLIGNGESGYRDSKILDGEVKFNIPAGMVVDSSNKALYIADYGNNAVRRVMLGQPPC